MPDPYLAAAPSLNPQQRGKGETATAIDIAVPTLPKKKKIEKEESEEKD